MTSLPIRIACNDSAISDDLRRRYGDCEVIADPGQCSQAPFCRWLYSEQLATDGRIQAALTEAVETLERTRHAFRSRDLAQLRQRLEQLLEDLSVHAE